jgi:hypothetical protein
VCDVYVNTFLESRDVTFLENIFSMKDSHSMSRLPVSVIAYTTPEPFENFEHAEHTLEPVYEEIVGGEKDRGLQSLLVMISLSIS